MTFKSYRSSLGLFALCVVAGMSLGHKTFAVDAKVDSEDAKSAPSEPAQLSVAPLDHVEYPSDRPAWLSELPSLEGDEHRWSVVTPACDTEEQAAELLTVLSRAAVESYVEQLTSFTASEIDFPIQEDWIRETLTSKTYAGEVTEGNSPRFERASLLVFTPETQASIHAAWKNHEVQHRLAATGLGVFGLLVAFIFGSGVLTAVARRVEKRQSKQSPAELV